MAAFKGRAGLKEGVRSGLWRSHGCLCVCVGGVHSMCEFYPPFALMPPTPLDRDAGTGRALNLPLSCSLIAGELPGRRPAQLCAPTPPRTASLPVAALLYGVFNYSSSLRLDALASFSRADSHRIVRSFSLTGFSGFGSLQPPPPPPPPPPCTSSSFIASWKP